jgi:hypothetical protein
MFQAETAKMDPRRRENFNPFSFNYFNRITGADFFGSRRASFPLGHCAPGRKCIRSRYGHGSGTQTDRQTGQVAMTITADERECTEQLARFFPKLPAVRIPVQVTPRRNGQSRMKESTVVEFGTAEYAIFRSKLALEFDDRVRLIRDGGGQSVEAAVIALQYHEGRKAVAVRFLDGPCKWMMQP